MSNALTDPPFAKDPPVKVNVDAKVLGIVLMILGALGVILNLISLLGTFGFCSAYAFGCGFPVLWMIGQIIGLVATALGAYGGYRMYQLDPRGKDLVIYGVALGVAGAVITFIGTLIAYSGLFGVGVGAGAFIGLIFNILINFVVYYLVVISRFPGQPALSPSGTQAWGGPSSPPPPPPSV